MIDNDREIIRLWDAGCGEDVIAERLGVLVGRVRWARKRVVEYGEMRPVTQEELGLRRFVGEVSRGLDGAVAGVAV